MNLDAPRFSADAQETEPDPDREVLNLVRLGRWDGALGIRDDAWFREHASDPELRKAVMEGVLLCAGSSPKLEKKSEQVRRLLGINDEDLRAPDARRMALTRAQSHLANANTPALLAIHRLVELDASFFTGANLTSLAQGITKRASLMYTDNHRLFADLSAMPVPARFYKRPEVVEAARTVQMRALAEGRPDAVAVMRHIGMDARAYAAPEVVESAHTGASKLANAGKTKSLLEYADAFGIKLSSIHVEHVKNGLLNLLRAGNTEAAKAFTMAFPHLDEQALLRGMPTGFVREGLVAQVSQGDLNAADAFIAYTGMSDEDRNTGLETAVLALLNIATERTIQDIMKHWHLPASLLRNQGASYIQRVAWRQRDPTATWNEAVRVKHIARISQPAFEDAFLKGITRMGEMPIERRGPYPTNGEIEDRIRDIKGYLAKIPDRAFAGRAERTLARRLADTQFRNGDVFYLRSIEEQFPFLDDVSMRRSAVRAVERLVMQGWVPNPVIVKMNDWLLQNELEPVRWNEVAHEAYPWMAKTLAAGGIDQYLSIAVNGLGIPADVQTKLLDETRSDVQAALLSLPTVRADAEDSTRKDYFRVYGFSWATFPFKHIPLRYLLESQDSELVERRKQNPWGPALKALAKIQARAKREEYDPWVSDLFPMVAEAERTGILDREAETDGQLLVEYVKTFGMVNLKETSHIYFRLKRGSFEALPDEDKRLLIKFVGPKAARMEREHLINELRKLRFDLQRELLEDKNPRKVGTALGLEAFNAIIGESQWTEEDDKPEELLALWKETVRRSQLASQRLENEAIRAVADQDDAAAEKAYAKADAERERVEVARGYQEITFTVPKSSRSKEREETADKEIREIVAAADESLNDLRNASTDMKTTLHAIRVAPISDRSNFGTDPIAELSYGFEDLRETGRKDLPIVDMPLLERVLSTKDERAVAELMERVAAQGGSTDYLRQLSVLHLGLTAPEQWARHLAEPDFPDTAAELAHRAEFVRQYVREHYLNPSQNPDHTGHAPFSEPLRQALERAWHAEDESTGGLLAGDTRIRHLREWAKGVSKETMDVTLVPTQGLARVYAGHFGDACYTSKQGELAKGAYPRIRALAFVTNRNRPKERIAGSVLFVETRVAATQKRMIVVRANNPRQNLVMQADAPALVRATIDAAIATAKRRGIKHVGVVRDSVTAASSNRPEVSDFYESEYAVDETKDSAYKFVELVNEDETNFKDYPIWDPDRGNPTVLVWTNDDPNAT